MQHIIKNYPLSCLCAIVIWVLCLVPIPDTPLSNVNMIDKWTHIVMYGGWCTVLWIEYGLHHHTFSKWRAFLFFFIVPTLMGGLIEIVQQYCTGGNRSGDFIDFLADVIGVATGTLIGIPAALRLSKRDRDSQAN